VTRGFGWLFVRLAVIGLLVGCIVGSFSYVAGWLSPGRLTQRQLTNGFEQVYGVHPGFRRNHAKGLCISGYFDSNGQGVALSKASVFKLGRVPVIGRFSLPGGQPYIADSPASVRGMALELKPRDSEEWRMAMIDIPVFIVRTAAGFYDQLLASQPDPVTGKPDPVKMKAFFDGHPESVRALAMIKTSPFSSGFADATYHSLNAFRFVNAAGDSTPVRWSMVPNDRFKPEDPAQSAAHDKNFLFDDLIARVQHGPALWRLMVTVGQAGDPTNDATIPWPENRQQIDVGTLTINNVEDEEHGACRDLNFDPMVLPFGIDPSDDPLLSARSAVYSVSFTRREGEKKEPSAVKVLDKDAGG
jgi:catalase